MKKLDPSLTVPTARSESQDWIEWHKQLKKVFGKKAANGIWVYAWSKRGGIDSKANTRTLANYMEGQGVDFDRTSWDEVTETILDFGTGFSTALKWTGIIVGGVVLVILIRIFWNLSKDPSSTIANAAAIRTGGRLR
jgi:hypothetical protein